MTDDKEKLFELEDQAEQTEQQMLEDVRQIKQNVTILSKYVIECKKRITELEAKQARQQEHHEEQMSKLLDQMDELVQLVVLAAPTSPNMPN